MQTKKATKILAFSLLAATLLASVTGTQSYAATHATGVNSKCSMNGYINKDGSGNYIFNCKLYNNTGSTRYAEAYLHVYNKGGSLYKTNSSCGNTNSGSSRAPAALRVSNEKYAKMSGILHSGTSSSTSEIDHVKLTPII